MAKEHKKAQFNKGSNISLSNDKELFADPSSAKLYANNSIYNEGELTMDGDVWRTDEVYFFHNDICRNCGQKKDHDGQQCRAVGVECFKCSKVGHFGRMCQSKDKPNANTNSTTATTTTSTATAGDQRPSTTPAKSTTPAQKKFQAKTQRKKTNNQKITACEEVSNSEDESLVGDDVSDQ